MLYNPQLETFLRVADAGSFNKAAAESFLTPTAVIKQIDHLEADLGVRLFERTHRGLFLTEAGKSLYLNAKKIIQFGRDAAQSAQNAARPDADLIRIGTSPLTPTDAFFQLWPALSARCPNLKFELIPYENSLESAQKTLSSLGTKIDVIAGIFDDELLKTRHCDGLILSREPICVAVSLTHRLAERSRLSVEDLYGENLMMIQRGWCNSIDRMRDALARQAPEIHIKDFAFFNVEVFNRCENSKDLLMAIPAWAHVHPLLKILPVDWPYTIPFGLFHSPRPTETVQRFLDAVREVSRL